jgi:hypothetical protein
MTKRELKELIKEELLKEGDYKAQAKDIEKICKSLISKSKKFTHSSPYMGDLLHVLDGLKELDEFLQ